MVHKDPVVVVKIAVTFFTWSSKFLSSVEFGLGVVSLVIIDSLVYLLKQSIVACHNLWKFTEWFASTSCGSLFS